MHFDEFAGEASEGRRRFQERMNQNGRASHRGHRFVCCSYAVARDETANEYARLIFINGDRIPPHDRFTDRIARIVDDSSLRHLNPFTCRVDRIWNEVTVRAELPVDAMPVGDITAMNAAWTAHRLNPRSDLM